MKTLKILLTVLLGVFLSVITTSAQSTSPPTPSIGVPEPSTLALLGIGLAAGLGYKILKKKRG